MGQVRVTARGRPPGTSCPHTCPQPWRAGAACSPPQPAHAPVGEEGHVCIVQLQRAAVLCDGLIKLPGLVELIAASLGSQRLVGPVWVGVGWLGGWVGAVGVVAAHVGTQPSVSSRQPYSVVCAPASAVVMEIRQTQTPRRASIRAPPFSSQPPRHPFRSCRRLLLLLPA